MTEEGRAYKRRIVLYMLGTSYVRFHCEAEGLDFTPVCALIREHGDVCYCTEGGSIVWIGELGTDDLRMICEALSI